MTSSLSALSKPLAGSLCSTASVPPLPFFAPLTASDLRPFELSPANACNPAWLRSLPNTWALASSRSVKSSVFAPFHSSQTRLYTASLLMWKRSIRHGASVSGRAPRSLNRASGFLTKMRMLVLRHARLYFWAGSLSSKLRSTFSSAYDVTMKPVRPMLPHIARSAACATFLCSSLIWSSVPSGPSGFSLKLAWFLPISSTSSGMSRCNCLSLSLPAASA
mmetsp:Transcript_44204/g.122518  ORF Transcript_44204/g.122518 Transcript_44204/m.122518 type:complete len:220 (+) Transcript_44204:1116-1775(+)